MMEFEVALGVNPEVVHVDLKPMFGDHVCKDMVHEGLESRWSIAEPKEHDGRFKESKRSDERSFPLVFFMNANVIKSPSDVELSEDRGVLHVVNQFGDKRQGVGIADIMGVQVSIVLARTERAIFLCYKEKGSGLWGFGRDNLSGLKVFRGLKIDGVVIGPVGRKNIVGLLREYIFKVRTPIRNFLIGGLCHLGEFGGQGDLIEMFTIGILLRKVLTKRHIILRRILLGEKRREFHVRVTSKPSE